jgi:hypothetical protein
MAEETAAGGAKMCAESHLPPQRPAARTSGSSHNVSRHARQPDRWEGLCTLQALADIAAGRTDQAEARLALAKTPPIVRISPDPPHVPVDCREPTAAELRQELDRIRALAATS